MKNSAHLAALMEATAATAEALYSERAVIRIPWLLFVTKNYFMPKMASRALSLKNTAGVAVTL
jgi:hypothetical protein